MAIDVNIPSQVKNYANLAAFPATGTLKTIFIAEDTNKTYRWTGSAYVEISATAASTWGAIGGTLSNQTDLQNALNAKQDTLVSATNIKTINGTTLLGSGDLVVGGSSAIAIGTTAITSGTVGRVLFEGTGNVVQESANLFWDNTNGRLGIGTSSPNRPFHVVGQSTFNNLIFNDTSATTVHTNIELKSDNAYETGLLLRSTTGLRWQIYVNNYTTNNFIFYNYKLGAQAMMISGASNNVLINTTTDAGFKLDVNGTARVQTSLAVTTGKVFSAYQSGSLANDALKITASNDGAVFGVQNSSAIGFSGIEYLNAAGASQVFTGFNNNNNQEFRFNNVASGGYIDFRIGGTSGLRIFNSRNVGINTTTDIASSKLTIESTTQGFLPPRMTTTQKNAIATPATGLMVYDTTLNLISVYNGTIWISL